MTPDDLTADHLTRDGHLTTLSLERHLAGEIDATPHLEACADCHDRWTALQADAALFTLRPPTASAPTRSVWPMLGAGLAIASALAFFVLRPGPASGPGLAPASDGVRTKGGFAMRVYAHDGTRSREVFDGDAVEPGDRIGFRLAIDTSGHLMIIGRDGANSEWIAFPQHMRGQSSPVVRKPGVLDEVNLQETVRLDATPGDERIAAVFCAAPFDQAVAAQVFAEGVPEGCRVRRITLRKPR